MGGSRSSSTQRSRNSFVFPAESISSGGTSCAPSSFSLLYWDQLAKPTASLRRRKVSISVRSAISASTVARSVSTSCVAPAPARNSSQMDCMASRSATVAGSASSNAVFTSHGTDCVRNARRESRTVPSGEVEARKSRTSVFSHPGLWTACAETNWPSVLYTGGVGSGRSAASLPACSQVRKTPSDDAAREALN